MYSKLISVIIALALSSWTQATPIQPRQDPCLILADTVNFIAKTVGTNPNPSLLPDVNNWLAIPVHSGAGQNVWTLNDPSTHSSNLSAPGFFRNGTDSYTMYLLAGLITPDEPYSIIFATEHQNSSSNPGAQAGYVELNIGYGTQGIDVIEGQLNVGYAYDIFYACPNVVIEGGHEIVVGVTNRYADTLPGCWEISLYAQCTGNITDEDRAAFPEFQQASCYANATSVAGPDS